eukprot:1737172-Pleurochrysis_carterae.AAC.1
MSCFSTDSTRQLHQMIVGAGLDPQSLMRLKSLTTKVQLTGRDDYGRAPATSGERDYKMTREADSPLDHGVAVRLGVSTQEREGSAQ